MSSTSPAFKIRSLKQSDQVICIRYLPSGVDLHQESLIFLIRLIVRGTSLSVLVFVDPTENGYFLSWFSKICQLINFSMLANFYLPNEAESLHQESPREHKKYLCSLERSWKPLYSISFIGQGSLSGLVFLRIRQKIGTFYHRSQKTVSPFLNSSAIRR